MTRTSRATRLSLQNTAPVQTTLTLQEQVEKDLINNDAPDGMCLMTVGIACVLSFVVAHLLMPSIWSLLVPLATGAVGTFLFHFVISKSVLDKEIILRAFKLVQPQEEEVLLRATINIPVRYRDWKALHRDLISLALPTVYDDIVMQRHLLLDRVTRRTEQEWERLRTLDLKRRVQERTEACGTPSRQGGLGNQVRPEQIQGVEA